MSVTPASLVISGCSRRGGRPKAAEPGHAVSSWVPERHADELMKLALHNGVSVSEFVKNLIVREVSRRRPSR